MKKITLLISIFLTSFNSLAQSIECQIMREQILSDVRQARQQEQSRSEYSQAGTMMNPSLAPLYEAAAQQGRIIGNGIAAAVNSGNGMPTLEEKIKIYKQRCE